VFTRVEGVRVATGPVEDEDGTPPGEPLAGGFDAFFASEYRAVVGLASVLCGRRTLGEEFAQEAFFRAFRHWDRISGYDDPGAWVRRVVANLATSSWRSRMREARAFGRVWRRRDPVAELTAADDEFWAAVRALPARQAQCLALRYLEDRSIADIAAVLAIAEPTVRVHLHAGRRALAQRIGESQDDEEPQ
jgi:RNA polymerase sigma-70 factor (ECF subfamily)